jgi:ribonuclease HII
MPPSSCSLEFENQCRANGATWIAGVDEAGRGPLAGPLFVAAVILPPDFHSKTLTDSKALTARTRDRLFDEILAQKDILHSIVEIPPGEIDRLNILQATRHGMRRAVSTLTQRPDHALIDGLPVPDFPVPQTAIVKGDGKSFSIAAASILAKVSRDKRMKELDEQYPQYAFAAHKGYGTALHLERLQRYGPSPIHRLSFAPVRQQSLRLE